MRTLKFLFVGAVALMTMLACSNEEESGPNNEPETTPTDRYYADLATITSNDSGFTATSDGGKIHFKYKGGQVTIFVSCGTEWLVENDNPSTFSISIKDPYLIVSAEQNLAEKALTGTITLMTAEQRIKFATITITQSAYGVEIIAETNKWNAPAIGDLTKKIGVDATDEWEFENSAGWLTVEKNDDGVCLTAEENREFEERVAEVVLICTDGTKSDTETITVIQDGLSYINLSEESLMFNMNGGEVTVAVESNFDWEYTYDSEWFTAKRNEEYSTLTITCDANNTGDDRKCVITITAGDRAVNIAEVKLTIVQGAHASIAVSTNEWHAPAVGELETEITVEATGDWTVENTAEWLTVKKIETGLTLTVSENSETLERSANIVVSCSYGDTTVSETIKVTQDGAAYITLSQENLLLSNSGSSASVTVESNFDWDYSYDTSNGWFTIEKNDAKSSLTVTYTANETGSDREGLVSITAGDGAENLAEAQLSITQSWENTDALILEYTITLSSTKIELPIRNLTSVTIDWDDGSTTTTSSDWPSHTYSTPGIYTITISGTVKAIRSSYNGYPSGRAYLTGVKQWGNTGLTSMYKAFYGCSGLASLPDGAGSLSNVTSFEEAFYNCSSLEELPEGLFDNCPSVTTFYYCFYGCSGLTSIPAGLFDNCPRVTSFSYCFCGCSRLTGSISSGLFDNCPSVTTFRSCFSGCSRLTGSIPSGLFDNCPSVTTFRSCFYGCSGLTSIPAGLFDNCPSVTTFYSCFYGCSGLTSIPAGLFDNCPSVTTFEYCFYGCSGLTSIPSGLFDNCPSVTTFEYCFHGCSGLTSVPYDLFSNSLNATNFSYCFYSCSSLVSAPSFEGLSKVTTFQYCFYGCSSLVSPPSFKGCTSATTFYYTLSSCDKLVIAPSFEGCSSMRSVPNFITDKNIWTTLPENMFSGCSKITSFSKCFYGCSALETVPVNIFDGTSAAVDFSSAFYGCSSVKGESPYTEFEINGENMKIHLYERGDYYLEIRHSIPTSYGDCFTNSTFSDIDSIPSSWGGSGN